MSDMNEKDVTFGEKGAFHPGGDINGAERRGSRRGSATLVAGRKMSRIGPPLRQGSLPDGDDETEEHARLVALEADNAIQYRTCSWQKVRNPV